MSLEFIIDGYNLIKHPLLAAQAKNSPSDRSALLNYIRFNKLTGSPKNSVTVVFDGYPDSYEPANDTDISVVFSRMISADDKIRKLVEESGNRKQIVVVSNDREIQSMAKMLGATVVGIETFVRYDKKAEIARKNLESDPKLTFAQMQKINDELRKLWLKTS